MINVLRDGLDCKHMQKTTEEYFLNRYSGVSDRNSCYSELCIKWKNQAYKGGQTKMAYFFLLKITYRYTN